MKLGTTLNGISGVVSRALGRSAAAPRPPPPPRPPGGVWAPAGGVGVWPPPEGAGVWANRVTAAESASAQATPLIQCVFISSLDNGAKCNTRSRSRPPYFRSGFQQHMSGGCAGVRVSNAAVSQITGTALTRLHGNGRAHACFSRRRTPVQDFRQAASSLQGTPHRIHCWKQSVQHGLVAERGFAPL